MDGHCAQQQPTAARTGTRRNKAAGKQKRKTERASARPHAPTQALHRPRHTALDSPRARRAPQHARRAPHGGASEARAADAKHERRRPRGKRVCADRAGTPLGVVARALHIDTHTHAPALAHGPGAPFAAAAAQRDTKRAAAQLPPAACCRPRPRRAAAACLQRREYGALQLHILAHVVPRRGPGRWRRAAARAARACQ